MPTTPTTPFPGDDGERRHPDLERHDDAVSGNLPKDARPDEAPSAVPTRSIGTMRRRADAPKALTGTIHVAFGAVEDLLADLTLNGAPDGGVVRVERLVRTKTEAMGGTATLGIAVTARREDEVLSAWVIVGRLALDPWGQPLDRERARRATTRHRDAQHLVGALFADAGFEVRLGLYLLPEACFGFAATCDTLDALAAPSALAAPTSSTTPDVSGSQAGGDVSPAEDQAHASRVRGEERERLERSAEEQRQDQKDGKDGDDEEDGENDDAHA